MQQIHDPVPDRCFRHDELRACRLLWPAEVRQAVPVRVLLALVLGIAAVRMPAAQLQVATDSLSKLDPILRERAALPSGRSRVIVRGVDATQLSGLVAAVRSAGGAVARALPIVNGCAATVPNAALTVIAASGLVQHLSLDRVAAGALERTGATVGSTTLRQQFGYDGGGVTVAIIDSGITSWHDDLAGATGTQRVDHFVDFVNGTTTPYDDYGHGTHVAGIVAGDGFDSSGARGGIAPAAHIVALKVLDRTGAGRISDVIAALGYVVAHSGELNIRVVNLSVAAAVYESYNLDPLTLAAKAAVDAGIVVIAAAGNNGRSPDGATRYGGVTSPGNAPWVLTVGASSHMGTVDRSDDTIAVFSSRGPTAIDGAAKPDVVAPGVGIESLSDPSSGLYSTKSAYLLNGTASTTYLPYLSLSGTSMSAPVVAGTVALMLQANPTLTPNAVKAILEYTAQPYAGYDRQTQGAGFLDAGGAVEMARSFAVAGGGDAPAPAWNAALIWGSRLVSGGRLRANASAWSSAVTWGSPVTNAGEAVDWGVVCLSAACDATSAWTLASMLGGSAVNGVADGDTVVWGTTDGDTVVWGTTDGDTVVWGTSCTDPGCEPVVWPR